MHQKALLVLFLMNTIIKWSGKKTKFILLIFSLTMILVNRSLHYMVFNLFKKNIIIIIIIIGTYLPNYYINYYIIITLKTPITALIVSTKFKKLQYINYLRVIFKKLSSCDILWRLKTIEMQGIKIRNHCKIKKITRMTS